MSDLQVFRIPFSTNVERIALAAGFKGLEVEWIDVDPNDRSPVVEASGQELVPVAINPDDGSAIADSPRILEWMEARWPDAPLWPTDPEAAASANEFVRSFNEDWKVLPNRLTDLLAPVDFEFDELKALDRETAAADVAAMVDWLDFFEQELDVWPYLGGNEFGICDVTAYPFLKYGVLEELDPGDEDAFHDVLLRFSAFDEETHPLLTAWVERISTAVQA